MYEYFYFNYDNAVFEWDDEKAASNFAKHGIRFETASKVFADENCPYHFRQMCYRT